jgi:hypothetical protein
MSGIAPTPGPILPAPIMPAPMPLPINPRPIGPLCVPGGTMIIPDGNRPFIPPGLDLQTRGISGGGFTESDRRTLKRTLELLKAARADVSSKDPKVAKAANRRLMIVLCYVAGFFDGKNVVGINPGLASVAGAQLFGSDINAQLDHLQKQLEDMSVATRTGLLAPYGAALMAIGIGMRMLGDAIDEK